jgi:hypothetical protein
MVDLDVMDLGRRFITLRRRDRGAGSGMLRSWETPWTGRADFVGLLEASRGLL